jgi:subtilase family serine protease
VRGLSGLAAGASSAASTTVTIPANTLSGTYYICAMADSLNQVAESNETNNVGCTAISTRVEGLPDLIMTQVEPNATTVVSGTTLSETDTVQDIGTGPARPFNIAYHLSTDSAYGNGDDIALLPPRTVGSPQIDPSLMPGESNTATTILNIPAATPPGTYHLCAMADWNGLVAESDESNNSLCSTVTVTVVPPPDLIVSSLSTTASSTSAGGTIPVSISVTNQGGVMAGTSVVAIHLSTNAIYGDGDDIASTTTWTNGSIYQGTTVSATTQMRIPDTIPTGSYYICVMADSTNAVLEGDEGNNTRCTATTVNVAAAP